MEEIALAWDRYAVLLFRRQQISAEDQRRFVSYFGDLQLARSGARDGQDTMFIGNVEVDGLPSDLQNGEMWFHQDGCYTETPTKQSFLYAIELPSTGGNTRFASTHRAFTLLPDELRSRLPSYDIRFTFNYSAVVRDDSWVEGPRLTTRHRASADRKPMLFCTTAS